MARSSNRFYEALYDAPWVALLVMLLVEPLLWSVKLDRGGAKLVFDRPRVHSGDEPHYLVMLNSLLADGDLDLANNYGSVHQGSNDAGASFAHSALDHHIRWYDGNRLMGWWQIFETDPARWRRDARGAPAPTLREGVPSNAPPKREYSWHPPGLPLLLYALLRPLRGSPWIEPAALCCSTLAVVAAMFLFRILIAPYAGDSNVLWTTAAVAFLGTPAWHYGGTLFCEPYL
ncbi:MAG TPA: hypothetical protein PK867_07415, partial [Pirellulales bacterium]|nr:hypothetical protein [Pirellulales bacterium]